MRMEVSNEVLLLYFNLAFLSISFPLAGQVMQFRDNEDLAIYGDDITEFTWVRGQYTNHRGDNTGSGGEVGGIRTTLTQMKISYVASCATPI